jgi:hypothetical protein
MLAPKMGTCFSTNDWWSDVPIPLSNKITITKRRATTVFDRYAYTILKVSLSDIWEPTNYTSADFVPIFEAVFTVPIRDQGFNISTQSEFLMQTYNYFLNRINSTQNQGADEGLAKLRSLFAVPVLTFNNVVYSTVGPIPADLGENISLAKESYRVITHCVFLI